MLRGGRVDHPKYAGRRICSAGINLTHLYQGKISFLFYFQHVMGYEHKMFRGLARPDALPDDVAGSTIEKPWIAVVDAFAIGGGCQHLLVMDYVLAEAGAYLTLPARKEGIIPGMANLRLPRFVGDRLARQAIMYGRRFDCDSAEGRLICDEIAPADQMDAALAQVVRRPHQLRGCQRRRQPPPIPNRARAARPFPTLPGALREGASLLPLRPRADRQSRASLERAVAQDVMSPGTRGMSRVPAERAHTIRRA